MSRARTWRSSTAGPRVNSIGCRRWRPNWFAAGRRDRSIWKTAAFAAKAATTTIPIVFNVGEDPVRLGLVASLARPGGNLTGINIFTSELVAKRLELLREMVPAAARVAVLVSPHNASTETTLRDTEAAARAMGLQVQILNASTSGEIDAAFATLARERADALFVDAAASSTAGASTWSTSQRSTRSLRYIRAKRRCRRADFDPHGHRRACHDAVANRFWPLLKPSLEAIRCRV